jgi:HK97 family phage major capsid protein
MSYNGVDESTHVGSMYGGVVGYWVAEGVAPTASKPKFFQVELKLKEVAALCYATNEQLEDTPALTSWLTRTVPNVLRFYTEDAVIEGDGVGKPLGIMNSPALVTVFRTDHTNLQLSDINRIWSRRWRGANDYVWLIHPEVTEMLDGMTAATAPVYLPPGGLSATPYGTLKGRPVIETEYNKALYDTGDILLASLSQYQAIDKAGGVQSASSIHVAFTTRETAFLFTYRIAGAPLWNSALTMLHGTNTVSPFVTCSSASS